MYRLRANCYSRARAGQRCILCPLSAAESILFKIGGTNLFLVGQYAAEKNGVLHRKC